MSENKNWVSATTRDGRKRRKANDGSDHDGRKGGQSGRTTKTTAAKKPDLTWLGLGRLDSSRTLARAARNPAARESVTALIHGASMPCGPWGRAGNYGPGPDRRVMVGWLLFGFFFSFFFPLTHLRLSWVRPSHAVAPRAGAHPESPPLPQSRTPVVGPRTHSFQVPATLAALSNPFIAPRGTLFSYPTTHRPSPTTNRTPTP